LFDAGKKNRNVIRRVLSVAIQGKDPGETQFAGVPPAGSQGGSFPAIGTPPNYGGPGPRGFSTCGISGCVIHNDDLWQMAPDF
jgi:hypothetical protein